MKRVRTPSGTWEWTLTDDETANTVLAVVHALAATLEERPRPAVAVSREPGIGRCPFCGAWTVEGACSTPHDTARLQTNRWQRNAPSNALSPTGWTRQRERAAP